MPVSAYKFMSQQSGAADFTSDPIPVAKDGFRRVSLTLFWSLVASTSGTLSVQGTDDPDLGTDSWVNLTVGTYHGTWPTVGAAKANALVVLDNCPLYVRVKYVKAGGGGANQFQGWATRSS